ncbi:hypothetical protein GH714_036740 [Hevea brasiliensis]|uniref:Uncharacterized protein n=1 Tax=Hevea brasiliensis TaxID=3981 RepID=A0A6A6L9A7_HEVBR|nr:hypothetical protein GH714_036740 [Hevea brasiliensis]
MTESLDMMVDAVIRPMAGRHRIFRSLLLRLGGRALVGNMARLTRLRPMREYIKGLVAHLRTGVAVVFLVAISFWVVGFLQY